MRAITVTGATLALVGCVLFVMSTENGLDTIKESVDKILPESDMKEAIKIGDAAKGPVVKPSEVITPKTAKSGHLVQPGEKVFPQPKGKLQNNCLALKAFAYTTMDATIDAGFKNMGVTFNLLRALTPSADAKKDNVTPVDCVKQFQAFVSATKKQFPLKDAVPRMQLGAITHFMEHDGGILVNVKMGDKKVITIDGKKVGLSDHKAAIAHLKDMAPMKSEVLHTMQTMKGSYTVSLGSIETAEDDQHNKLTIKQEEALDHWDGDIA